MAVDIPALGRVPVNLAGVLGLGILGVAEPALWLVGAGLETAYLFTMACNPRFQRLVDASHLELTVTDAEAKRKALVGQLPTDSQKRMLALDTKCERVLALNRQTDDLVVDTNRDALSRLAWVYLKLLIARHNLVSMRSPESEADLTRKASDLEAELAKPIESDALRYSRAATLRILKERLANIQRTRESLAEIDSDLARIEAQVQLIVENASIQGKPHTISTDIDLASNLFAVSLYGDSQPAIADLDEIYRGRRLRTGGPPGRPR
jgi:hypothetical protein